MGSLHGKVWDTSTTIRTQPITSLVVHAMEFDQIFSSSQLHSPSKYPSLTPSPLNITKVHFALLMKNKHY